METEALLLVSTLAVGISIEQLLIIWYGDPAVASEEMRPAYIECGFLYLAIALPLLFATKLIAINVRYVVVYTAMVVMSRGLRTFWLTRRSVTSRDFPRQLEWSSLIFIGVLIFVRPD